MSREPAKTGLQALGRPSCVLLPSSRGRKTGSLVFSDVKCYMSRILSTVRPLS